jgi:dolichol-phosphate mannosyltransferase
MSSNQLQLISIVIPVYNEEENIPTLYTKIINATVNLSYYSFEFVFIDDCSSDNSYSKLQSLKKNDHRIQIIRFSKNFGAHAAVAAGLHFCNGSAAIKMAADLQDPPEIIPLLIGEWEKGPKVVWGRRKERKGESFFTLLTSKTFYVLMNLLTTIKQPLSGADVTLIDRKVISELKRCNEKNASNNMLIAWLGFSQTFIEYTKQPRLTGLSKWTFAKRIKLFFDSLISFSYVPLRLMSLSGVIISTGGLIFSIRVFYKAFFTGYDIAGWPSLMIAILVIGGFQMIMLGVLGEYVWRNYDETRSRPMYIIESNTLTNN